PRKVLVPPPAVVARISWLEADANVFPNDVHRQLALFHALVDTNLASSYEVVISRWERMCEFHPNSPLLHSADAFKIYLSCLVNTGRKDDVSAAVRRRDTLLATHPSTTASTPAAPPTSTDTDPVPHTDSQALADATLAQQPQSPPLLFLPLCHSPTNSQILARAVLAGQPASQHYLNHDGPIEVTIIEPRNAWRNSFLRFILMWSGGIFLGILALTLLFENVGMMKNGASPTQSEFQPGDGRIYTFNDVHGVDEAKEELQDVVAFLKDPTAFAALGGKLPKGVLLVGPPGTGKTLLARAVAGEAGVPFFFASGSEFEEMFVGVGAKRIRELFSAAKKKEPAIIFIDELDSIGGKRSSRDQQYAKQTLNQLLTELDGFMQNEGIIVIAATNIPDSLDPALVRPGRFDRLIQVPLPDVKGRIAILQRHTKDIIVAKDVDIKRIARGTPQFSGADLHNLVNSAAVQAAKEKAPAVTTKHLEWAKDRIIMGAERKFTDEKGKLATAYHEGGHVITALFTPGAVPLHKVTVIPRGQALGVTSQLPEGDVYQQTYQEFLARVDVAMGGRVAEEIIYGHDSVTSGASSDIRAASYTARYMVKSCGFSKLGPVDYSDPRDYGSPTRSEMVEQEVSKIIDDSQTRVRDLLKEHESELHLLARALVEHETLDADEVRKVIKGEPLKDISDVLEEQISIVNAIEGKKVEEA
ncbi:P-loop containing nucleoside triphosphate hydrolase protein, partial [Cyathus striatus]